MDDVHEVLQGNGLAICEWSKGAVGSRMEQGVLDIGDASKEQVMGGRSGHEELGGEPGDSVCDADGPSFHHPDTVAAVGFKSRAHIPSVLCMGSPTWSLSRFAVNKDADARWGNGSTVEVKGTMEVGPGREFGVKSGAT